MQIMCQICKKFFQMRQEIELINNQYCPQGAIEVLGNLIQQKMAFLSIKTRQHQEMFGTSDLKAESSMSELKQLKQELFSQLHLLDPQTVLQINSHVSITVVDQQQAS